MSKPYPYVGHVDTLEAQAKMHANLRKISRRGKIRCVSD
jgi:hypothetical protein